MIYNRLKYFYVVARHMNISRAAEELFISQPALSTQIKALEDELGAQLFIRTNRNLLLTEAGEILYSGVASFFDREADIFAQVRRSSSGSHSQVRFAFMSLGDSIPLPEVVGRFRERHPQIEVSAERMNMDSIRVAMVRGDLDVALIFVGDNEDEAFFSVPICRDKFVVAMSSTNPLAEKQELSIADLKGRPFLMISRFEAPKPYERVIRMCRAAGFEPEIVGSYPYVESIFSVLQMSSGISLLAALSVPKQMAAITERTLPEAADAELRLCMISQKKNRTAAVETFINEISAELRAILGEETPAKAP